MECAELTFAGPANDPKRGIRLLIIEDNPADARLVKENLEQIEDLLFDLRHATRLSEVCGIVDDWTPDIILLDLGLPDSYGFETISTTQALVGGIPLVVLTGDETDQQGVEAIRQGADDYATKSTVDSSMLARVIRYTLERYRFNAALKASEERNRRLVENAPIGIFLIAISGQLISINPALTQMLGHRPDRELIGKSFFSFIADPAEAQVVKDAASNGDALHNYETTMNRDEGEPVQTLLNLVPLRGSEDNILAYQGTVSNIDALKVMQNERLQLERQLNVAQKLEVIGQLTAGVAHEINTPIQFIADNLSFMAEVQEELTSFISVVRQLTTQSAEPVPFETLVEQLREADEKADIDYLLEEFPMAVKQALEGSARIKEIVGAIKGLAHTRPKGALKELSDINYAIQNTIIISRNEWKYVAELSADLDPDLPSVVCDVGKVNQVILNMLVNSAHAIDEKHKASGTSGLGQITISTKAAGDDIVITISDDGCGIPKQVIDKIYEPFYTTKGQGKGTGQGLAITKSIIVEQHGGSIDVESQEGEGTTFILKLPINGGGVETDKEA